jgi:Calcineurin-like phosphoesterase
MKLHFKHARQMNGQKTNRLFRVFSILFLIITISPLACTPSADPPVPTEAGTEPLQTTTLAITSPLTFVAEADAQVNEASSGENTGTSKFLQVDGDSEAEVESFLRFTITGTPGTIQTARLRLYNTTNASENGPAVYATDPSWTEEEITWNQRPERLSEELANQGSLSKETWVEYDVTKAVTGNGTFSFVLAADSNDAATFSSRQGSQPPELVITLANGPTPTVAAATVTATAIPASATFTSTASAAGSPTLFVAEADARVKQSDPARNYGDDTTLHADGAGDSGIESFLRFTVTEVSAPIQSARLRLYVTDNGTEDGPAVYATSSSWAEDSITWDNRPAPTSEAADNRNSLSSNSWAEYDVTPLVISSGTFSFVLVADSSDGVIFSSREGEQPPQLVLTLQGGDAPTAVSTLPPAGPGEDAIFVGAGDISSCRNDNDELTAQLLDGIPGTVFTTGDNAYDEGTMDEYLNCYAPTWGRHKDRTRPVPGNHEYLTSGAAGYFQYFDNVPSYYAYNLGSWRIYALNSEIDVSENSPQITWLKTDLASNPAQCVLAYWHRPRWSSGVNHGSSEEHQALWQILYEAGAELVLNGHEHHYERFAEMNAEGAAVSPGLREIVAGMGGRNLYEFDSPLPASEVRENTTFGVLKLTLRPDGYAWEFVSVPGSTFTDSGSTNCH